MIRIIAPFLLSILITTAVAQTPQFEKFNVGSTGCTAYFPGVPEFSTTLSEDSSIVYTAEVSSGDLKYALICVQFKEPLDGTNIENMGLLKSYLDFLQVQFEIISAAGYGEGYIMESNPDAIGVIDFWEDVSGDNWNVKAWIDDRFIAVLCIYGPGEINYGYSEFFLNGFVFQVK